MGHALGQPIIMAFPNFAAIYIGAVGIPAKLVGFVYDLCIACKLQQAKVVQQIETTVMNK
jgi:hypothetical protein